MESFWQWAGSFWWLIFPLGGVIAGGARALYASSERAAERRHERKLEKMRLKAGFAPGTGPTSIHLPAARPREVDSAPSVSHEDLLSRLFAEHDEITARWLDYELDVAKLIAFPAMSDGRQPLTAAFLRAKKTADALRPASIETHVGEQQISEYLDAVGAYAVAFEVAEREARRLRDSTFSEAERKKLDRAQKLLKVAVDESATQAERNIAYKRVRQELDGLIVLSDQAVEVLENQVAREIAPPPQDPPA
ncbi:hypothetical protein [uncultured Microbacterium sp.]|uniref:hypothetical protein n=1 Tax=uncultured Microbacterium sp. TaxID=191216 RepID=UPI002627110C|nr:hypothetical protein [uncultured Microbacterium sp.]